MATRTVDPISALLKASPLDAKTQRHLRKVYLALTYSVLLATLGAVLEARLASNALGRLAAIAVLPAFFWFQLQSRQSKNRPLAFYTFAFLDGVAAGPLVALATAASPRIPLLAFAGAVVVFAGFSVSAVFARRRSYLFLGSFLWSAVWGLLFVNFINVFTAKFYGLGIMIYGGLMVFCGFVLYDTQLIIEKVNLGDDDHLAHALELFLDFIVIFKRLLIIMLKKDQERKERDSRRRRND